MKITKSDRNLLTILSLIFILGSMLATLIENGKIIVWLLLWLPEMIMSIIANFTKTEG